MQTDQPYPTNPYQPSHAAFPHQPRYTTGYSSNSGCNTTKIAIGVIAVMIVGLIIGVIVVAQKKTDNNTTPPASIIEGDLCEGVVCQNDGQCNAANGECVCAEGFSGAFCETEEQVTPPTGGGFCASSPCKNGGRCSTSTNTCSCTGTSYSGAYCQTKTNGTTTNACATKNGGCDVTNGVCKLSGTTVTCSCKTGYELDTSDKKTCSVAVETNKCSPNPCQNGGTCKEADGTCTCPSTHTGATCATAVSKCSPNPCLNGGTCKESDGSCTCTAAYKGTKCDTAVPQCTLACQNGGKCVLSATNTQSCQCATGFSGDLCDKAATTEARSEGCGKTTSLKNGEAKIASSGRQYTLRLPNNYDKDHAYRLIFAPHCLGANMQQVVRENYYNLIAQANESAILVAPNGAGSDNGWGNGASDLQLFDDMVKLFFAELCINTRLVFSTGFSYGGAMSHALACARPKVYRSVLILDGGVVSGCTGGNDPVAYFQAHGVSDSVFPIAQSASSMRDRFLKNNGCAANQNFPSVAAGSRKWGCTTATGCQTEYPVRWCTFDGGHVGDGANLDGGWLPKESWKWITQFS